MPLPSETLCRHFLTDRCTYGEKCIFMHQAATLGTSSLAATEQEVNSLPGAPLLLSGTPWSSLLLSHNSVSLFLTWGTHTLNLTSNPVTKVCSLSHSHTHSLSLTHTNKHKHTGARRHKHTTLPTFRTDISLVILSIKELFSLINRCRFAGPLNSGTIYLR